jgi:hypothetical protein
VGFAVYGEDGKWRWADAWIEGNTVVIESDFVRSPVAVRYGWSSNPTINLYSPEGLPAAPFRSDDFPAITRNARWEILKNRFFVEFSSKWIKKEGGKKSYERTSKRRRALWEAVALSRAMEGERGRGERGRELHSDKDRPQAAKQI